MNHEDLKRAERADQHRRWLMANGSTVTAIPHAGEAVRGMNAVAAPEGEQPSRWLALIQNYAQQMTTPDNAIKIEVLMHLHDCIGTCIEAYLNDSQVRVVAATNGDTEYPSKK